MNLAEFFKHDFSKGKFELYDRNGNIIFIEHSDKYWIRFERDENGNTTLGKENSEGITWGVPKAKEIEMTVKELQDFVSKQKGTNVKLKIKE